MAAWFCNVSKVGIMHPVRKGPAGIQVNLNTWNLKKNTGGFFSPSHEMEYRWKAIYSNKMRWNMQIFPPGIFFQVEILPKNLNGFSAKFHLKFTSKNSSWKKNNPAGIYQTIGSPIQLLTMILLLNFTDFPSAWSTAPHHQLLKW